MFVRPILVFAYIIYSSFCASFLLLISDIKFTQQINVLHIGLNANSVIKALPIRNYSAPSHLQINRVILVFDVDQRFPKSFIRPFLHILLVSVSPLLLHVNHIPKTGVKMCKLYLTMGICAFDEIQL